MHYHILNGDSLKDQFPHGIKGELIVTRECLVDGPVRAETLEELFSKRAEFLGEEYTVSADTNYWKETVPELKKIQDLTDAAEVNLWFEDDLFCQVNLWFAVHLMVTSSPPERVYLVRPPALSKWGFAGLTNKELISLFENRTELKEIRKIARLWELYSAGDLDELDTTGRELERRYPFISQAVRAHLDRMPRNGNPGRPMKSLQTIIRELNTDEFGPVFKEFTNREFIYGFGDLQVKRMLDELKNNDHQEGKHT